MEIKLSLVLIILLSIVFIPVNAQHDIKLLKYNVKALGKNVGEFTVSQNTNDEGILNIESVTDIKIRMLVSYHVKYTLQSTHKNGILIQSHLQTTKNNKLNSDTWLIADANNYIRIKDQDTTIINNQITYTGNLLYFNEPNNIKHVYKEKSGEKRLIKPIGDHMYALVNSNGDTTHEYTYKDGIMVNATIKNSIADIYLEYCN